MVLDRMVLDNVPELEGYKIIEKLVSNADKSMYLVDGADGGRLILKVLRQTHKFPIYDSLARLTHVNMPTIHKVTMGKDCFSVLEDYIEGRTLQEILETDGVFDTQSTIDIVSQLCDVLMYLHNQPSGQNFASRNGYAARNLSGSSIIHRDIKPANIMLTGDGMVKLVDDVFSKGSTSNAEKSNRERRSLTYG